jgi:NAD(P)-dependent dehydrogenase (short-subunit alcohol dehydrogenase family)
MRTCSSSSAVILPASE